MSHLVRTARLRNSGAYPYACAGALAVGAAYLTAHGQSAPLIAVAVMFVAVALFLKRIEAVVGAWLFLLLADGRVVSHIHSGPIYITEIVLTLLVFLTVGYVLGYAVRLAPVNQGLWLVACAVVPALFGLALHTNLTGLEWLRNLALVEYVVFVIVGAALPPSRSLYRLYFRVVLFGAGAALVLVATGNAGADQGLATSTGAIRLAHGSFSLPFGIAALVLIAAINEHLISRRLLILVVPFLIGLVLINHRSAWIGFALAFGALVTVRLSARRVATVAGLLVVLLVILSATSVTRLPSVRAELTRASTVTDSADPNAQYRLVFWQRVLGASMHDPVFGAGFNDYPSALVPPQTADDPVPAPHNSFVALIYRVGWIGGLGIIGALLVLLARAGLFVRRSRDPFARAVVSSLGATILFVGVFASFNVELELPYGAPLFWLPVGLLIGALAHYHESERRG